MVWNWIDKGAKRLQELGDEYKQHHTLVERLIALDPVAAQAEVSRLWPSMDVRASVQCSVPDVANRSQPKTEEVCESARKGIEKHAPAVEAAVKSAVNELL